MDLPLLFFKTILLRPYVFIFLLAFLYSAQRLLGWKRTIWFFGITWATAFICEFSSTRTGIPFGWYYYTGSTIGQELYITDIPFMDSLSFTFLLFASYGLALLFLLPGYSKPLANVPHLLFDLRCRTSWPVILLTCLLFAFIDIVIDPVALRGSRWFLGQIYGYAEDGVYFGVPIANFLGWAVVGFLSLTGYTYLDRSLSGTHPLATLPEDSSISYRTTCDILLACGLYYGVLFFNLGVTFWIGEWLLGTVGIMIYLPVTTLALLRIGGWLSPTRSPSGPPTPAQ